MASEREGCGAGGRYPELPSLTGHIRNHVDESLDNLDFASGMSQALHPQRAFYEMADA